MASHFPSPKINEKAIMILMTFNYLWSFTWRKLENQGLSVKICKKTLRIKKCYDSLDFENTNLLHKVDTLEFQEKKTFAW